MASRPSQFTIPAEFHAIDFPRGHGELIAEELSQFQGMAYRTWTGGLNGADPRYNAKRDYYKPPRSGWIDQQGAPGESNVDQAIWIHLWKTPKREKHFKDTEFRKLYDPLTESSSDQPIAKYFDEEMRQLGALRITNEYYRLMHFPTMERPW